ncbi:hypothetical protein B5F77_04250 [Parabacteroides sp. An277]|nr:hypothetical protein B5F77_04250 [Parabacteroides sp. An277]
MGKWGGILRRPPNVVGSSEEFSTDLPQVAARRRKSPQASHKLQQGSGIFRKPPANCSKAAGFSASLPQTAARRRDFPQASCKLQQGGGIFRCFLFTLPT